MNMILKTQADIRTQIVRMCGITDDEYKEFIMANGMAYLKELTGDDFHPYAKCRGFWEWFTNQFQLIDTQFIQNYHQVPLTRNNIRNNQLLWISRHAPWKMAEQPIYRALVRQAQEIIRAGRRSGL